jgi:four helix bundle protein
LRRAEQIANIAERHGRFYYQDNVRFCYNARGSLEETRSHLAFAFEAKLPAGSLYEELATDGEEIGKILNGYISCLNLFKTDGMANSLII